MSLQFTGSPSDGSGQREPPHGPALLASARTLPTRDGVPGRARGQVQIAALGRRFAAHQDRSRGGHHGQRALHEKLSKGSADRVCRVDGSIRLQYVPQTWFGNYL